MKKAFEYIVNGVFIGLILEVLGFRVFSFYWWVWVVILAVIFVGAWDYYENK